MSCPYWESNAGRPARSPPLYQLNYPGSQSLISVLYKIGVTVNLYES
jgi:hypothetical protein